MRLRVLHIGNIANNAYNIAKALREKTDIEADVFTNNYCRYISQPEWEDVDFDPVQYDDFTVPDWDKIDLKGFRRPDWYFEVLDSKVWTRLSNFQHKEMLRFVKLLSKVKGFCKDVEQIKKLINKEELTIEELKTLVFLYDGINNITFSGTVKNDYLSYLKMEYKRLLGEILTPLTKKEMTSFTKQGIQQRFHRLFSQYDIIQAYGVWEPMYPLLLTPSIPLVTFEHGSMRDHPFMPETVGRLLALAYKKANKNIITNGDSINAIRRLGLNNCVFIPHPVDDAKFYPYDTDLRKTLLEQYECSYILFTPSRQNWQLKGNEKIFLAFSKLLKNYGKVLKLFVCEWGQEVERSKLLVKELGIEGDVVWLPPLCKRRLAEYYNASDVVLDQFTLGAFGTTTPEAMACGKPVVLYYKPDDHEWCFKDHPPVINAYSSEDIYKSIKELFGNRQKLGSIGKASLEWYKKNHSLDVVVSKHLDVYKSIQNSPNTVTIPYKVKKEYFFGGTNIVKKVVAIIKCRQPSLGIKNKPQYLREVCGKPLIQIMADRLTKIPIKSVIMVANEDEPETIKFAKGLGWKVVVFRKWKVNDVTAAIRVLSAKYIALFDLNFPFVDQAVFNRMYTQMFDRDLDYINLTENVAYGPTFISKRNLLIRGGLFKIIMLRSGISWKDAFKTVLTFALKEEFNDVDNIVKTGLTSDNVSNSYIKALGGVNFDLDELRRLENNHDLQIKLLYKEMLESESPHLENKLLNDFEIKCGKDKLLSYPTFIGLNMTSICNAKCTFCSYAPNVQKHKDILKLDDLKKMTWLKYVSRLAVWGGIGDSLVNPEFLMCYRHLKTNYPHLDITFSTNGIKMTKEICEEFAGHLADYNVSLNAAISGTWEKLMKSRGFDNVLETFEYLAKLKKDRKTNKPFLSVSMVLVKENLHEAVDFVNLAHKIGAEKVTFVHYVSSTLVGKRELEITESPYFMKDECDKVLNEAAKRADKLGLQITKPLPFSQENGSVIYGERTDRAPSACYDPWKTCYLTVDEDGNRQMIFCCSGFYYGIKYDKSDLEEKYFMEKIWNHPMARYFRKTTNIKGKNPICGYCMTYDRFDPNNNDIIYGIGKKIEPILEAIDSNSKHSDMDKIVEAFDRI